MKKVSKKVRLFVLLIVAVIYLIVTVIWLAPACRLVDESNAAWSALSDQYKVALLQDVLLDNTMTTDKKFAKIVVLVNASGGDKDKSYQLFDLVKSESVSRYEASGAMQGLLFADTVFEDKLVYLSAVLHFCQVDDGDYLIYLSNKDQFKLILEGKIDYTVMKNSIGEFFLTLAVLANIFPWAVWSILFLDYFVYKKRRESE